MTAFYVASTLDNADQARRLAEALKSRGHACSYSWWRHGSVWDRSVSWENQIETLSKTASAEHQGVLAADVLILLLPGGSGAHTEFGIALAPVDGVERQRRVIVCGKKPEKPTIFWFHPRVEARLWIEPAADWHDDEAEEEIAIEADLFGRIVKQVESVAELA